MNFFERVIDALSLYSYEEEELDEALDKAQKPVERESAVKPKEEQTSFFRKKETAQEGEANASASAPTKERERRFSFSKAAPAKARKTTGEEGKMSSRTLNLPVANKMVTVVVLEPASFDDSQKIADYLRGNEPVVVNFQGTDNVIAKRMTDFISGTIYALGGSMRKLGRDILICAPKNVDIDAGEEVYDERGEQPWKQ